MSLGKSLFKGNLFKSLAFWTIEPYIEGIITSQAINENNKLMEQNNSSHFFKAFQINIISVNGVNTFLDQSALQNVLIYIGVILPIIWYVWLKQYNNIKTNQGLKLTKV